jgi:hypothetical protein
VGLETVEEGKSLWDFELPSPIADQYLSPRKYRRYQLDIPVELFLEGSPQPIRARTSDIGLGGCYVPLLTPARVGISLMIRLWLGERRPRVPGRVVFSNPGVGMGIEFGKMSEEDRKRLQAFLECPGEGVVVQDRRRQ